MQAELEKISNDERFLAEFERRASTFQNIIKLAVKNTLSEDWVDYGDKAWLSTPGAERVARVIGLTSKEVDYKRVDRSDDKGEYYIYIVTGKIGMERSNVFVDVIGTQSSRKAFWAKSHGEDVPPEEIKEESIIKDAFSNFWENGTTRFLGLRGLPWGFLEKMGISKGKGAKPEFKKGGKKSPAV